jgi:hypothetical protein
MVLSNGHFDITENSTSKSEMVSVLMVRNVTENSLGKFDCVAKNSFGSAESTVRAYCKAFKSRSRSYTSQFTTTSPAL